MGQVARAISQRSAHLQTFQRKSLLLSAAMGRFLRYLRQFSIRRIFQPAMTQQAKGNPVSRWDMKPANSAYRYRGARVAMLAMVLFLQIFPFRVCAQNLGTQPVMNRAVQGESASQPEGAFLNMVNWIGNVIAPVGAALCVVMAVVSYSQGRGVARWAITAAGLLAISGLTRLIEFWINQGGSGIR